MCEVCGDSGRRVYRDETGRVFMEICKSCTTWRDNRIKLLERTSNLPTFHSYNMISVVSDYVDNYLQRYNTKTNWLLIAGKSGAGKTTQAVTAGYEIIKRYMRRVKFYDSVSFFRTLIALRKRQQAYDEAYDGFIDAEVVILDDFLKAVPNSKSYEYEDYRAVVIECVWGRYSSGKPLIITTQSNFKDFMDFDEALSTRFVERCPENSIVKFGAEARNWRLTK